MGNTKKDLPEDIVATLYMGKREYSEAQIKRADEIVERAKTGYYHDFDSELPAPKMQLHADLLEAGLVEIDQKMQNGDYDDEHATPEQEEEMLEQLKGSPLEKMFRDMMKKGKS